MLSHFTISYKVLLIQGTALVEEIQKCGQIFKTQYAATTMWHCGGGGIPGIADRVLVL